MSANLQVLQYAPNATNSRGGTKLLCQSDFYLGSRVAKVGHNHHTHSKDILALVVRLTNLSYRANMLLRSFSLGF